MAEEDDLLVHQGRGVEFGIEIKIESIIQV